MNAAGLPKRVCLITPGHLSTNPRIVKEADALAEAGCEVTVISADYLAWGRGMDRAFTDRPWRSAPKVRFGPDAPVQVYLTQTLRRRGGRALVRALGRRTLFVDWAIHPAAADLTRAARSVDADLYVAHYTAALPAAAAAARLKGARYAFDAEDFHPGDLPEGDRHAFDRDLVKNVEARLLPGCAYITAASPGIADAYADAYGLARPSVVLNVFPRSDAPCATRSPGSSRSLYWFSQTLGTGRGIEAAVEALALAEARPSLHLRGAAAPGYVEGLKALAHRHGVEDRLEFLPPDDPSAMVRLASQYAAGLAAELHHTHNHRIALSNKLFTYLLAGMPVIASDIPAHRDLEDFGGALTLYRSGDPKALAAALDQVLLDPDRLARARQEAWRLGQTRYNWDIEKEALLAAVREGVHRGQREVPS